MLLIGFLISLVVAYGAYQRRSLTVGGAGWAVVVGSIVFGYGGGVAGLALLGFFLSSSALSRYRRDDKARLTGGLLEKGDQRDALQVLANGGPAALFSLIYGLTDEPSFYVAALAALASANADTWATELGLLSPTPPRHLLGFREVPAGTSGAVSRSGLFGSLLGALFIAALTALEPLPGSLWRGLLVAGAGFGGGLLDSLLGAVVQERRQCLQCGAATEQRHHDCGGETICIGGLPGLDNDAINALATAGGGGLAALLWWLLG
jgi:uncharacterized protein (TIGR00297 family)